jgi:hypothetical protein
MSYDNWKTTEPEPDYPECPECGALMDLIEAPPLSSGWEYACRECEVRVRQADRTCPPEPALPKDG